VRGIVLLLLLLRCWPLFQMRTVARSINTLQLKLAVDAAADGEAGAWHGIALC